MCLGELAEVLQVGPGPRALVRAGRRPTTVSLLTLEEPVAAGDWVVCHSGFALSRVTATEAAEAAAIRATADPQTMKATTTEDEQ
ncbi:HypC/HybG/HupF family hydrogenase formation chaperone [Pedococcus bigeumensis]|jgi:hydrogenase expression/formation protein HypC|uniref:HypC/HybG/HupF family hydrogenase formation chaperone n=1 Tax=Pedococcus bigeumensis TaxID=433644 RepID=UPI002FED5222